MEVTLGRFGDRRLEKGGSFCSTGWLRLGAAESGYAGLAQTARARSKSRGFRATRRSASAKWSKPRRRALTRVAGRHVLAIQDTTTVRAEEKGRCIALHPVIAVDAIEGALLGFVDGRFFMRNGDKAVLHKDKAFAEKEIPAGWPETASSRGAPHIDGAHAASMEDVLDLYALEFSIWSNDQGRISPFIARPAISARRARSWHR
jgi:hypothetical protein